MSSFIYAHGDYILFLYGLALGVLGLICLGLARLDAATLPWKWLALFALARMLREWLRGVQLSVDGGESLDWVVVGMMVVSSSALVEFGRRQTPVIQGRIAGLFLWGILIVALLTATASEGFITAVRYALVVPGGLLSAYGFWRASRNNARGGRALAVAAAAIAIYTFFSGLGGASVGVFVEQDWLLTHFNVPAQAGRCVMAIVLAGALWFYRVRATQAGLSLTRPRMAQWWVPATVAATLVVGWLATEMSGHSALDSELAQLRQLTDTASTTVNPRRIRALSVFTGDGRSSEDYRRVYQECEHVLASFEKADRVFLAGIRDGKAISYVQGCRRGPDDPQFPANNIVVQILPDAPVDLLTIFQDGKSRVVGPYGGGNGMRYSGFSAIRDDLTGRIIGVLGIDEHANLMATEVASHRVLPIVITLLLVVLLLLFAEVRERDMRALARETEAGARVQRAMNDLSIASAGAEVANRAKSQFLANMSHEIRTPLTAILGYADLIGRSDAPEAVLADAEVIRRNGEHLLKLVNEILDLAKIESGKIEIARSRCLLPSLLADVAALTRVQAEAKGLQFEIAAVGPVPETVLTDPLRLRQLLVNLVGNAVKFTDSGRVTIAVKLVDDNGQTRLQFSVSDTGIGMTGGQMAQLFQPFHQVDESHARQFGGTGLGLVLSKHLAELLGGMIKVDSTPGKGSTFRAMIDPGPLDGIPRIENLQVLLDCPTTATAATSDKVELHGRILLVEDGPDNQRLIAFVLKKAGAEVTVAENGQVAYNEALAAVNHGQPFDVILMDMQMPIMDGYEATRRLRAEGYRGPIIALTAHAMAEDYQKCIEAGCDDYAAKPIDRQTLLVTVARWASRQWTSDDPACTPTAPHATLP